MALLHVSNLHVQYKETIAVDNISFSADQGEIVGFIGADGAGKSSLFHAIAGVVPFSGEISYHNYTYHSPKEAEKIKPYLGLMPQGLGLVLYPELSVKEHLEFFIDIRNLKKDKALQQYTEELLHMAGLAKFTDRLAKHLSGGMKQKLSLICTLVHRPQLLILDEPTTGVDPVSRRELWEILQHQKEHSLTLFSTAYMDEAQRMDRVHLMHEAKVIAQGTPDSLIQSAKPYTYEGVYECDTCISFQNRTYALSTLPMPHAKPTLESLFFINALQHNAIPPKISIAPRSKSLDIPPIVMEAKGLTKRFGDFVADDHIDMQLQRGEILGLLGANGAGKTTFIKMLLGLYPIDEGDLYLLGKKISSAKDREDLKSKIGYMSQNFALYKDMSIKENLLYFANLHHIPLSIALTKIDELASSLGFAKYLHSLPKDLPLGINQRFSLAAAILHEPVVLFLDEPTSGVDTIARAQFWDLLHQLKNRWQISILITTHYMSEANFCDRVVVLKSGKKIVDERVDKLFEQFPWAKSFEDIFFYLYQKEKT